MKGLTKTIVALALVIAVLATMGMSAMAEQVGTYSTKTTYQANNKISVTAKATGLKAGDIVTYVATTDASDVNENTIVYINQAEVVDDETPVTFDYTTDVTNINASMFFGGSVENERKTATAEGLTLTVKLGDVTGTVDGVAESDTTEAVIRKIKLPTDIDLGGKKLTGVTFIDENGTKEITEFYATDGTLVIYTDAITDVGGTLELTAEDATGTDSLKPSIAKESATCDNDADGSEDDYNALAKAPNGDKFGVVVYTDKDEANLDTIVDGELTNIGDEKVNFLVLPALGRNGEGIFAVVIEDYKDILEVGSYKVKAYAMNGNALEFSAGAATLEVE